MKSLYKLKIHGVRGSQLSNFIGYVETLSGVTVSGIKRMDRPALKKKRTFRKSTPAERAKMLELYKAGNSVEKIAKETDFSIPTVERYTSKRKKTDGEN